METGCRLTMCEHRIDSVGDEACHTSEFADVFTCLPRSLTPSVYSAFVHHLKGIRDEYFFG